MSFLQQMENDLAAARTAAAARDNVRALEITTRYVGPMSRSIDFLSMHVALLQGMNAYAEAEPFIDRLIALNPANVDAINQQVHGLRCTGRHREAYALVVSTRQQHPDHVSLLGKHLGLSLTINGPEDALALLRTESKREVPGRDIRKAVEEFRQKILSLADPERIRQLDTDNLLGLGELVAKDRYSLREIYERFESLGSNCDFGQVQRLRGAEPLSVLGWTTIDIASLTRMLANDLAGLDDPSIYHLSGNENQEFFLNETLYRTVSHTGINLGDVDRDEALARLVRRQIFLRRKFLDDLRKGEKIFVYKGDDVPGEAEMAALEEQLVRLGARKILITVTTSDPAEIATVRATSPHRLVGSLSAKPFADKLDEWDKVVVATYDHFR